jgi:hypothetical protein
MREIEEHEIAERVEGFFYQARNSSGLAAGHRFVGRSANGDDLFRLTQVQRDTALSRFASIMGEFGYTGTSARKDLVSARSGTGDTRAEDVKGPVVITSGVPDGQRWCM